MTHEKALEIATQFLYTMNPEKWNGVGEPPASFNERLYEEPIAENIAIEISFICDNYGEDEEWGYQTCIELVDFNGNSYGRYTFAGEVNKAESIADCIDYLCEKYVMED